MTGPRAILFDLDDTLISSYSSDRMEVWGEALAAVADRLGGRSLEAIIPAIENEARWFWSEPVRHKEGRLNIALARRRIVAGGLAKVGIDDAAVIDEVAERFHIGRERRTRLFDDAHHVLDAIKAAGFKLCLITNGEGAVQRAKVERFDLGHRFHHIQIEGEHPFGKPEPAAYAHALATLEASAAEAWIVGDNLEWEVAVPQRLGFGRAVWVDAHGRGLPKKTEIRPTHSVSLLRDILPMLGLSAR